MPAKPPIDPREFDFSAAFQHLFGKDPQTFEPLLVRLDVDLYPDLIDALTRGDKRTVITMLKHPERFGRPVPQTEDYHLAEDKLKPVGGNGFRYTITPASDEIDHKMLDWLEQNKFGYRIAPGRRIAVNVATREDAYRVDQALARLNQLYLRDNKTEIEPAIEATMKKKADGPPKRNPMAHELVKNPLFRSRTEKTRKEREQRHDKWNRKAKHRTPVHENEFVIGQPVSHQGQRATVKVPHGPGDTVGILLDGETQMEMVERKDLRRIDEGVLGMTMMPDLQRMRELAGMAPLSETDFAGMMGDNPMARRPLDPGMMVDDIAVTSAPPPPGGPMGGVADMGGETSVAGGAPPTPGLDSGGPAGVAGPPPTSGLDTEGPAGVGAQPAAGLSISNGPAGAVDQVGGPGGSSEAFNVINDALNNVQRNLGEVKVNEFQQLVQRLREIADAVQQQGIGFVHEAQRRKARGRMLTERKSFRDYYGK